MNNQNLRPGVYTSYQVLSHYASPRSKQGVGLVGSAAPLSDKPSTFSSFAAAEELLKTYPSQALLLSCCRLLFQSGVSFVCVATTPEALSEKDLQVVVPLSSELGATDKCLKAVIAASEGGRERLMVAGVAGAATALALAATLNNPRGVIIFGSATYEKRQDPAFGACAFAALLVTGHGATQSLNGALLPEISIEENLTEDRVQLLLKGGVTPLEQVGEHTTCVRGVTTHTTTNGIADTTFRSVNTILLIDHVVGGLRRTLTVRLKNQGVAKLDLESISTQVVLELEGYKKDGILTSYQLPLVRSHGEDPSVCVVELAFTLAHVLSQIHLVAQVQL